MGRVSKSEIPRYQLITSIIDDILNQFDGDLAASSSFEEKYVLVWDVEQAKVIKRLGIRFTSAGEKNPWADDPPNVFSSKISLDDPLLNQRHARRSIHLLERGKGRPRPISGDGGLQSLIEPLALGCIPGVTLNSKGADAFGYEPFSTTSRLC